MKYNSIDQYFTGCTKVENIIAKGKSTKLAHRFSRFISL